MVLEVSQLPKVRGAVLPCSPDGTIRLHTQARKAAGNGEEAEDFCGKGNTHTKSAQRFCFSLSNAKATWCGTCLRAVPAEGQGMYSRLKRELVTCHSPEIGTTGQPVRRLDKHHFDQKTPACWISTYFLIV